MAEFESPKTLGASNACDRIFVVKIGGSLFDSPDLDVRIAASFAERKGPIVVVAGGGVFADRAAERAIALGESPVERHRRELASLADSTTFIVERLRSWRSPVFIRRRFDELIDDLRRRPIDDQDRFVPFDPSVEATLDAGATLAESPDVTTDSIAAWVTRRLADRARRSARLTLAKSIDRPLGSFVDWADAGAVDRYFPVTANGLVVDWINLRARPK
jgi:hypothetical protein